MVNINTKMPEGLEKMADAAKKISEPVRREMEKHQEFIKQKNDIEINNDTIIPMSFPMLESSKRIEAHLKNISKELFDIRLVLKQLVAQKEIK